jgi:hypothetical protein
VLETQTGLTLKYWDLAGTQVLKTRVKGRKPWHLVGAYIAAQELKHFHGGNGVGQIRIVA